MLISWAYIQESQPAIMALHKKHSQGKRNDISDRTLTTQGLQQNRILSATTYQFCMCVYIEHYRI